MKPFEKMLRIFLFPVFVLFLFALVAGVHAGQPPKINDYGPASGWKTSTPEQQGMQSEQLIEMIESIGENSHNIDSICIVRNGCLVLDAYMWPFSKSQKHNIFSCTKSIMSVLIGIAIDNGYIQDADQRVASFFPDKAFAHMDERKKSITLRHLLMMAAGLKCRDSYLYGWEGLWEMRSSPDWAQYVLDLPMSDAPGERFEYCNGVSHLLSVILHRTTKMNTLDFARKHLFDPLGIVEVGWETSPQGIYVGYGRMWLKPRDMAKIGWLYLNKGRWGDRQIVAAEWVEASTTGLIEATLFHRYGYQWWVDSDGYYAAVGFKGQYIFVVPEKNLVAVFTGDLLGAGAGRTPRRLLDSYIIPAAVSSAPLDPDPARMQRLDRLLTRVSREPAKGYIWSSEEQGVAKDGLFRRTASPAFGFHYPLGSKKEAIRHPGEIMRMKTRGDVVFTASVTDIPEGIELEDLGPKVYARDTRGVALNVEVVANNEIELSCGTKAYKTKLTYLWHGLPVTTYVVSAYKEGKCVGISVHTWKFGTDMGPIFQSLTFK